MEKQIDEMLEKTGMSEKKQKEYEELEMNKLSPEEVKKAQSQLARMRSLMFFAEQKQKRLAKNKSKL